jgi:threonine dehydratase
VSGGGLLSGTAITAKHIDSNIKVIGCEPKNADDAYRSLQEGKIVTIENPRTIADGLRMPLGENTFSILSELLDEIVLVTEEEIVSAMRLIWERLKIIIEASSAVAFAPVLNHKLDFSGKKVGVILSGGNVDLTKLPF